MPTSSERLPVRQGETKRRFLHKPHCFMLVENKSYDRAVLNVSTAHRLDQLP